MTMKLVGVASLKQVPKLTDAHKRAGILWIACQNTNGSFHCLVDLEKVDKMSRTNYRQYDEDHMKRILADYDGSCVRTPILRYHRGKLDSVDGRHSIALMLESGKKRCTADIYFDMSDAKAAKIFREIAQNTKRMSQWASFNAALTAKYKSALEIDELMREFGFSCPAYDGHGYRNSDIRSASPLFEAHRHGKEFLRKMFHVIDLWRNHTTDFKVPFLCGHSEFLRGLIDFLSLIDNRTDFASIIHRLTCTSPETYEELAKENLRCSRMTRGHYKWAFRYLVPIRLAS